MHAQQRYTFTLPTCYSLPHLIAQITRLLSDPRIAADEVRDHFQIRYKDSIGDTGVVPKSDEDASARLTRSTLYETQDSSSLRDFSRDVLLSKRHVRGHLCSDAVDLLLIRELFCSLHWRLVAHTVSCAIALSPHWTVATHVAAATTPCVALARTTSNCPRATYRVRYLPFV